jgi:antitoxin YefM
MKSITVSDFRANIKTHLDDVSDNSEIIVIPRNNVAEDAVVVMSIAEYNNLVENDYINASQKNVERLRKSLKQAKENKTRPVNIVTFLS